MVTGPLLVELAALASLLVGIGLVFVPAALIAAGVLVIFAVERGT